MTRERDRIQENANKCIVKNCPCFEKTFGWCQRVDDYGVCENTTDCLTKQVIEKCKETLNLMESASGRNAYAGGRCTEAGQILQLFDIEEVRE